MRGVDLQWNVEVEWLFEGQVAVTDADCEMHEVIGLTGPTKFK